MPSLKDVKNKIAGVRKTKQITKAMNMVASAKLRGAQNRIERFRPYAEKFYSVLSDLADKTEGDVLHPLLSVHPEKKVVLIVLATSDRGLCGGFNANLIALAQKTAKQAQAEGKEVKFICVGKKGRDTLQKAGYEIVSAYTDEFGHLDFSLATRIGKDVISDYEQLVVDEVFLIYGQFVSLSKQTPMSLSLLPVRPIAVESAEGEVVTQAQSGATEYVYEPSVHELLATLLPRFVNVQIFRGLLDTAASEHAARMVAMDNATRNCDDMTGTLTLLYNKTRQASITSELIDIVGGAEAIK